MKRAATISILGAALLASALAFATGCKQGEGEHCQVNEDCDPPLTCSANDVCVDPLVSQTPIDASVPDGTIDAPVDAAELDAALDAPDAIALPDAPDAM